MKKMSVPGLNFFLQLNYLFRLGHEEEKQSANIFTVGEVIKLAIIIGIAIVITIFSIEVQLRKLNKSNQMIVELLNEIKNKE